MVNYIPSRGDILHMNFSPHAGKEQGGKRFGVVLSEKEFNKSDFALVCPITTKVKGYPIEVPIPEGGITKGVALPSYAKILDWKKRKAVFIEQAPQETVKRCSRFLLQIMGLA